VQGGRKLMFEGLVDGVVLRPLHVMSIMGAKLVLRRLTMDVRETESNA
jgi:hypothetical protein